MSKKTRITNRIDPQRLAQLMSMPGIDPRVWVSLCVVVKVVVDTGSQTAGVFADVQLLDTVTLDDGGNPVAQTETVRVATDYAGSGFGEFMPPAAGDEVLVVWPSGHPDHGGVLIKRMWAASDPPPSVAKNNPNDLCLVIKKDTNMRVVSQGNGNQILQIDKGKVLLGNESGTSPVARKNDHSDCGTFTFLAAGTTSVNVQYTDPDGNISGGSINTPPGQTISVKAKLTEGSGKVEAA